MVARGALGNPWIFEELLGLRSQPPDRAEVLDELDWVIAQAVDHLGEDRAGRYLRRFYPWYVDRLGLERADARRLQRALQQADSFSAVRALLIGAPAAVPINASGEVTPVAA
jgi:tRNA-dihydrouridine synthase